MATHASERHEDWVTAEIAREERAHLDAHTAPNVNPASLLDARTYLHIRGVGASGRDDGAVDAAQRAVDAALAAHACGGALTVAVIGSAQSIAIYGGLRTRHRAGETQEDAAHRDAAALGSIFRSAYPGIILEDAAAEEVHDAAQLRWASAGVLTGIPTGSDEPEFRGNVRQSRGSGYLDRVIRGMRGGHWAYIVHALPYRHSAVLEERGRILALLEKLAPMLRTRTQETEVIGTETVDRRAQLLNDILDRRLKQVDQALAEGQWLIGVSIGAGDTATFERLAALLTGALSGADSAPDRIRTIRSAPSTELAPDDIRTRLASRHLGLLIRLPDQEAPGYAVTDVATFDVHHRPAAAHGGHLVSFGTILRDGQPTGMRFRLPMNDLTKHGLVAGVTGSGKTTTIRSLLLSLTTEAHVPFMVIEPAKTEYRALLGAITNGRNTGLIPDLRVYTLGSDRAPFRLNPFEFETDDDPTSSLLLNHIDLLKAVFNAAFVLYPPMPYILETALHEIYQDKGWDLATGVNVRLAGSYWARRHDYPIFPTLSDLYGKVEAVTRALGYEARIEQDVVAGLKARVGSLRIGSKGLMLDVPRGNPMDRLLGHPTILELENIGNDSEKTFVMGLVLARLYQYRRLQAASGNLPRGADLQHVLVIEEAHRLLQRTSTEVAVDAANLRAQAVETFVNMLSEIRRYAQGVLVAEQIPSKLAPDAIKNANLKIIHRLLAEDDRTTLAGTMNMSEVQSRHLITLPVGQAAVYAEGEDHPLLIAAPDVLSLHNAPEPSDVDIGRLAAERIVLDRSLDIPDARDYGIAADRFGVPALGAYLRARDATTSRGAIILWARIMAAVIYGGDAPVKDLSVLLTMIEGNQGRAHRVEGEARRDMARLVVALGAAHVVNERAATDGWPYAEADEVRRALTKGLLAILEGSNEENDDLARVAHTYHRLTQKPHGPYPGCDACRARCLYRLDATKLLVAAVRADVVAQVKRAENKKAANKDDKEVREDYRLLGAYLGRQARERLGVPAAVVPGLRYCAALVATDDGDIVRHGMVAHDLASLLESVSETPSQGMTAVTDARAPHYRSLLRQVIDTLLANPSAVRPLLRRHFAEIDDSFFDLLAEWVDHLRADARPEVITHLSTVLAIAHKEYDQHRRMGGENS